MSLTQQERIARKAGRTVTGEVGLEEFLLSMHRLSNALADSDVLNKSKIGISEWLVLKALEDGQEFQLRELVRRSGISRQRIRTLLQELEGKGLVTVRQHATGDKRQRVVAPTPEAIRIRRAMLADLRAVAGRIEAKSAQAGRDTKMGNRFVNAARLSNRIAKALSPKFVQGATEASSDREDD